jgi:hypothetical protein
MQPSTTPVFHFAGETVAAAVFSLSMLQQIEIWN